MFFFTVSNFQVLNSGLSSFGLMFIQREMASIGDTQLHPQHLLERMSFSSICFQHCYHRSHSCRCLNLILVFYSISWNFMSAASIRIILVLLLWFYSVTWDQTGWCLQPCFPAHISLAIQGLWTFIWILRLIFYVCKNIIIILIGIASRYDLIIEQFSIFCLLMALECFHSLRLLSFLSLVF